MTGTWRFAPHLITHTRCGIAEPRSGGRDQRRGDNRQRAGRGAEWHSATDSGAQRSPASHAQHADLRGLLRDLHDCDARNRALTKVAEAQIEVGSTLRRLAPEARIFFMDCLTILPDRGFDAPPLSRSTPIWVATSPKRSNATLPKLQRKRDVSSSERVRQAVGTTRGRRIHKPRKGLCRCPVARSRFSPMPPRGAPSPI
jgi:hypothetical protein